MYRLRDRLAVLIGTVFFTGYAPVAPGTAGTVAGVVVYFFIGAWGWKGYLLMLLLVVAVGTWSASRCEEVYDRKDSPRIVIDEVAGFLLSVAFIPPSWGVVAGGFILFRLFDIIKLPPADWADRELRGGIGVMLDDLIAGVYAWMVLQVIRMAI